MIKIIAFTDNPAPFRKCCVNGVTLGCGKALNCLGRMAMTQAHG
jgi:hypothetical protein